MVLNGDLRQIRMYQFISKTSRLLCGAIFRIISIRVYLSFSFNVANVLTQNFAFNFQRSAPTHGLNIACSMLVNLELGEREDVFAIYFYSILHLYTYIL